jgi:methionyl-tRNA formyltransferase
VNFAFAGTPDFAAWTLEHLASLERIPRLVISQPDRPVGRGRRATAPAAAVAARRLGLDLIQPEDINSPEVLERLRAAGADVLVVAAFGQLLKETLLDTLICVNVHGSLLPAHRGAAPIERALAAGEECTGVSLMRMALGLDTGPWALQTSLSVSPRDDAGSVGRALAILGAQGVDQVLTGLDDGTVVWTEQTGQPTYAHKLGPDDCLLDVAKPARGVHDQVRSLSPRVGARAESGALRFKVWRTWPYGQPGLDPGPPEAAHIAGRPGEIAIAGERLFLGCGQGLVQVLSVQPDGKSIMSAAAFLRGYRARLGDRMAGADDHGPAGDREDPRGPAGEG